MVWQLARAGGGGEFRPSGDDRRKAGSTSGAGRTSRNAHGPDDSGRRAASGAARSSAPPPSAAAHDHGLCRIALTPQVWLGPWAGSPARRGHTATTHVLRTTEEAPSLPPRVDRRGYTTHPVGSA